MEALRFSAAAIVQDKGNTNLKNIESHQQANTFDPYKTL
jgi:hypothetical protein